MATSRCIYTLIHLSVALCEIMIPHMRQSHHPGVREIYGYKSGHQLYGSTYLLGGCHCFKGIIIHLFVLQASYA